MTDKVKVVNYTPEQTARLIADYTANPTKDTVATLATAFGKTTKSVVAKLVREGVYRKAEKVSKDGAPVVKKNELVEKIATEIGVTSDKLDGLESAPKNALKLILAALAFDAEPADEAETQPEAAS
jgi:electron transfer flavoprotein alpha subunit